MADLLVAVEITSQEADVFRKMRETGCFEIKDGNCTLHFSHLGKLLKIQKNLSTSFSLVSNDVGVTVAK